jgi:hypothetical protein
MDFDDESGERARAWKAHEAQCHAEWLAFLDAENITPEQVARANALAREMMRRPRTDRWVTVEVENPQPRHHLIVVPARSDEAARDALFARYVDGHLERERASRLGPIPAWWRVLARRRWRRHRRALEALDARLIAAMTALHRSRTP